MSSSTSTSHPRLSSIPLVISISPISGQFWITQGSSARRAATMCLVAAFFEPRTVTSPWSGPIGSILQVVAIDGVYGPLDAGQGGQDVDRLRLQRGQRVARDPA